MAAIVALFSSFVPTTQGQQQSGGQEKTFKTRDFKDMPVAIVKVRNLQSDTWYEDLGIEVKNVSSKPIYSILAFLIFPDDKRHPVGQSGITLSYGERKYILLSTIADSRDPHLDPGETVVLTIAEQYRRGLKSQHERSPETFKTLELRLGYLISFGDGTGFMVERFTDSRVKNPD
jgi:hypothetical protein